MVSMVESTHAPATATSTSTSTSTNTVAAAVAVDPLDAIRTQLDAFGAVLGSEREWPTQVEIVIETEGFRAPAFVQSCRRRETDHALTVEFTGGFRWAPEAWRPDHAYAAPVQTKSAKAGG